jgi:hypothetical protein
MFKDKTLLITGGNCSRNAVFATGFDSEVAEIRNLRRDEKAG